MYSVGVSAVGLAVDRPLVCTSSCSVVDPSLAPPGKHSLHAYLPATEPYHLWEGVQRGSPEYQKLKEERSQVCAWSGAV